MTDNERAALVERVANLVRLAMQHPWAGAENAAKGILAAIEPAIRADDRAKAEAEVERLRAALRSVQAALELSACDCRKETGRCWDRNISRTVCDQGMAADALAATCAALKEDTSTGTAWTDEQRIARGLDPNGGFDGPTGAD